MNVEVIIVLVALVGMLAALIMDKMRPGMILFSVVVLFLCTGILSPKEMLEGFSNKGMITVAMLFLVLMPMLMKGWAPIPTTFFLCALVAVACFVILGGCSRKVACACLGTVAGMGLAMVFGLLAQKMLHLDGLRAADAEALLQLRQTGTPLGIRGLLVSGVIISALGAVMDVAMSVSSAMQELKAVNPRLGPKDLWKSGMNIGRDMVGTMTNTLILAILGSGMVLILYLYSLGLDWNQLMSSSYLGIEIISGVSSAIGVILAVPVTALVSALVYGRQK